jgi:hypothetical protein
MNKSRMVCRTTARMRRWLLVLLFCSAASAYAQKFEVTPLFGYRWGGEVKLQQDGYPNSYPVLDHSFSFGVAAGYRFDAEDCEACNLIEFRYTRQNTQLGYREDSTPLARSQPSIALDHFLGDFTHEFSISDTPDRVRPYVTVSLGTARMSTPVESTTQFVFGVGGGVKVFAKPHWGFRVQIEYLPLVRAEAGKVACAAGACLIALHGGVMNQFEVSFGPSFRF